MFNIAQFFDFNVVYGILVNNKSGSVSDTMFRIVRFVTCNVNVIYCDYNTALYIIASTKEDSPFTIATLRLKNGLT